MKAQDKEATGGGGERRGEKACRSGYFDGYSSTTSGSHEDVEEALRGEE